MNADQRRTFGTDSDQFDTDLDRLASEVLNPLPDHYIGTPRHSPAQLRDMARARERHDRRHRRSVVATVAASIAVLAMLVPGYSRLHSGPSERVPSGAELPPAAAPRPLPLSGASEPAQGPLKTLAATIGRSKSTMPAGRYTYVHTQSWYTDTTGPQRPPLSRDEQLWWAADRTGLQVLTTLTAPPLTAAAAALGEPRRTSYEGKDLLALNVAKPSEEPALLAAQLNAVEPVSNGPQSVARGVVDLYRYHLLTAPQRAAALTVLADTRGLNSHGLANDRAGRQALAISVDSDHASTRDILLFDITDGSLVHYERLSLDSAAPRLSDYTVFLKTSRTNTMNS